MSQSCNLNPFSKLLSHFSLFDSQFFAAPFAIQDCCLSCRRVALSDIFGLWQSTRVSISSRNIICALSQPPPERCVKAKISAKLKCDAQNNDEGLKEETRTMDLGDHPTVRRLSRTPERANQYPSEGVLDGAWLRRLASNCFVANIPKCISCRARSGCAKTAGTNADYVSKLRAIKMV